MSKLQIVLVVSGIIIIGLLYSLPKVIVRNENKDLGGNSSGLSASGKNEDAHQRDENPEVQVKIDNFKTALQASTVKNVKLSLVDSIINLFVANTSFDSAARYAEIKAGLDPGENNFINTGNWYSEAMNFAVSDEKRNQHAEKARVWYEKALGLNPENLDTKSKLAMTYVSSENPMKAIMILREVIEQDPKNETALFNLGYLSIQSGQFDKAVERFEKLKEYYPENVNARFYLAFSYKSLGKKKKARDEFELVKKMNKDPEVGATVDSYLQDLK